jgi:thymidylate kinase
MTNSQMKRFPIIAIEGIDGAGKTTVSRLLSDELGMKYIKTPTKELNSFRCFFDNSNTDPNARLHFYISCLWEAYNEAIQSARYCGVIFDRYICSTLAYHSVLCKNSDKVSEILKISAPPAADLNILLKIDVNTAAKRIKSRNNITCDVRLENNLKFQKEVALKFESIMNYQVPVNENSSLQEILKKSIKLIKNIKL